MIRTTSYIELCKRIIDIHKVLGYGKTLEKYPYRCQTIRDNISILERVMEKNKLSTELFTPAEILRFLQTLLDSWGMAHASGSEDLSISYRQMIGSKNEIIGNLNDNHVRDFQFSKLFQGWWNGGHKGNQIKDLASGSIAKKGKGDWCDYVIELKGNNVELVECKRIHPHPLKEYSFEDLANKVIEKMDDAGNQLSQTANRLHKEDKQILCRHFLLDISYYSNPEKRKVRNGFRVSGFVEEEIETIKTLVTHRNANRKLVDRITLCWSQVIFKEDLPIAIRQSVAPIVLNKNAQSTIDYKGWTVEAYPRKGASGTIVELRVSICDRGLPWIKVGYLSEQDNLIRWGVEEKREDFS